MLISRFLLVLFWEDAREIYDLIFETDILSLVDKFDDFFEIGIAIFDGVFYSNILPNVLNC